MGALCKCGTGLGNTGTPSGCYVPMTIPKGIFMVQTYDSTGAKNKILASEEVDDAYILDKINETDTSKRWYPIQSILNFASERADPITETFPNGEQAFIKDGVKPVTFEVLKGGAVLKSKIDKARCVSTSFFLLNEGRIYGMDLTDEGLELHPIRISANSLSTKLIQATDTTVEKLQVSFQYDQREYDGNLRYIETEQDADLLSYIGLLDIKSAITNKTTTGFKAKLYNEYGSLNEPLVDKGLVAADFALYNVTDSAAVVITSATESPDGTYTFVFTAQTSGDTLRLTPTSQGKDYSAVIANTILVP